MDLPRGLKLIHTERLIACLLHLSVTYCAAVGYRYCVHRTARILDSAASPSLYEISRNMNHALQADDEIQMCFVVRGSSWSVPHFCKVSTDTSLQSIKIHLPVLLESYVFTSRSSQTACFKVASA